MGSEKRVYLEQTVTLDEASMVKPIVSCQVVTMKTKLVLSQRVKSDATPRSSISSVSSEISSFMTSGGNRVVDMNTEYVEKVGSVAARETKGDLRNLVVKKHGSQVDEVHLTQSIGFVTAKKKVG